MTTTRLWRHFDFVLLGAVAVLIMFGVAMIRSATLQTPSLQDLPSRQIMWALAGFGLIFVLAVVDYHYWQSLWRSLYAVSLILLGLLFIVGLVRHGATRWFDLALFELQPSETAKIVLIISLAAVLARDRDKLDKLSAVLRTLAYALAPTALIFLQPDLSTAMMIMVIWFAMIWAAGLRLRHLGLFALSGVAAPVLLWPFMRDYMQRRIAAFLNPTVDPEAQYNVEQALISIGAGNWFGQGYGNGTQCQLRFLRVRHTDFIFSCTAEEFGFYGSLALILLIGFVIYRMLRAARLARDPMGAYICYGLATMLFYQSFFNIAMNMRLLPVSGIPLPFISYGGSSLLTFLIGIGLVESVVLRHKQLEF